VPTMRRSICPSRSNAPRACHTRRSPPRERVDLSV
jgi:hypothetical protein